MITYTTEVICDNCQDAFSGDACTVPNAAEVVSRAQSQGWKIEGDSCLCETCADVSKESRELAIADREVDIQRNDLPEKEAA